LCELEPYDTQRCSCWWDSFPSDASALITGAQPHRLIDCTDDPTSNARERLGHAGRGHPGRFVGTPVNLNSRPWLLVVWILHGGWRLAGSNWNVEGGRVLTVWTVRPRNWRTLLPSLTSKVCLKSFRCQEFFSKLRIHGAMLLRAPNKFAGASSSPPSLLRS
jgi:hypothetical protein